MYEAIKKSNVFEFVATVIVVLIAMAMVDAAINNIFHYENNEALHKVLWLCIYLTPIYAMIFIYSKERIYPFFKEVIKSYIQYTKDNNYTLANHIAAFILYTFIIVLLIKLVPIIFNILGILFMIFVWIFLIFGTLGGIGMAFSDTSTINRNNSAAKNIPQIIYVSEDGPCIKIEFSDGHKITRHLMCDKNRLGGYTQTSYTYEFLQSTGGSYDSYLVETYVLDKYVPYKFNKASVKIVGRRK